jgi:hypothetical protein
MESATPILHPPRGRPAAQLSLPGLEAAPPRRRRPLSHVARRSGQRTARRQAGRQAERVVASLRADGPQTDHELAAALGLALASVNSIRGALVKAGRVAAVDVVPGPYGALRSRWGLR